MADARAARCAAETAVRDERHAVAEPHAHDSRGRVQHLAHTGAALRTLIADDNDVARYDLARVDGRLRVLLALKHACRAFMHKHLRQNGRTLYNAALRRKITAQHGDAAGLTVRILDGTDNVVVQVHAILDVLADGLAGHGYAVRVQQTLFAQLVHHSVHAARFVKLFNVRSARRCQMAQVRGLFADPVCDVEVDLDAALVRDGRQMQHTVRGAAECHIDRKCVHNGVLRHDVTRANILSQHIHDRHACVLCKLDTCGIYRRDGAVAA